MAFRRPLRKAIFIPRHSGGRGTLWDRAAIVPHVVACKATALAGAPASVVVA